MPKKENCSEPELTPYERAGMYTVISKEETETHVITVLRTYGGAKVTCRVPKHTPEEEQKLRESITEALVRFVYPDTDLSQVKHMEVIIQP